LCFTTAIARNLLIFELISYRLDYINFFDLSNPVIVLLPYLTEYVSIKFKTGGILQMELGLEGKVALVTGAGSPVGFGRGIALTLAGYGCDIVANEIDAEGVKKTADEVEKLGRKAEAIVADVTKVAEVKDMVKVALDRFGRIDILVNNAGRTTTPTPFVDTPEENWEIVINLNIYGVFHCSKAVLPQMLERGSGKIVNIASGAGIGGMPRCVHYGASKAAVIAFTKGLAKEVISQGVYVNAVAPGVGDTNFLVTGNFPEGELDRAVAVVPTKRPTTPQDVGNMVAYLSSDLANQIVGQTFLVDGGHI
jgi:NAD(P)-dependent dehydrogenase (short-subunit alcohol dehydrogenase family)